MPEPTKLQLEIGTPQVNTKRTKPIHFWLEQEGESIMLMTCFDGKTTGLIRLGSSYDRNNTAGFKIYRMFGSARHLGLQHDEVGRVVIS